MHELDIRLEPRSWTSGELSRHDELPGQLELHNGKLCISDDDRLLLLGALLEHVGAARAVQLGSLSVWADAIAARKEDEEWEQMPSIGGEQFWKPSVVHISFKKQLEMKRNCNSRRARPCPHRGR